ncbi:MAG: OPT/YSL family transporter, partial [Lentihominibacter sp.]|nr:OPT/YSL family transporter [Lentihominibacter sp.]
VRSMVIGALGTVVITTSSMFIALKLSSLPWPIIFVALVSMFCLKAMGNTNLREINVAQTAMSAGAMVAGGIAFTIPGIWMLNPDADISVGKLLIMTMSGVVLGLIFTALIRKFYIEDSSDMSFPMGEACAETLTAGDKGGRKAGALFTTMGVVAVFTFLRDWFARIPATLLNRKMMAYGSYCGVYVSPMLVGIGYIIGPAAIFVWFAGAIIGDFGILLGGTEFGLWDVMTAGQIKQSLGIGLMVGTGVGIILFGIIPRAKEMFGGMFRKESLDTAVIPVRWAPFAMIIIAFLGTAVLKMGVISSILVILGTWVATAMSAQCVGQTGINPMEIFGILVLLLCKACTGIEGTEAFFAAAVVAVACGLCGDIMNDFKAGRILDTDPKAQWISECVGSIIGGGVSVGVLMIIIAAYGGDCFGSETFPAAQAAAVAAMVGGIPNMPAFIIGLVAAVLLYKLKVPVMTLGLGVYLPFYMSATAFIGGLLRFITDRLCPAFEEKGTGTIIASGLLGGEGITGVIIALIVAVQAVV